MIGVVISLVALLRCARGLIDGSKWRLAFGRVREMR